MRILSPRSRISNTFSFEKFVHPSKRIGSWSRNKGEKRPSIHLSAAAPFIFGSTPKYAIDSIDWIQDEISNDDNERPPPRISLDPALRTPCCTPLVLSSCEQRKARKSLWPRLDRKIAPHRTKRACLWDLPSPPPSFLFFGRDANRCCRISLIAAR